jgi:hypothetical protein
MVLDDDDESLDDDWMVADDPSDPCLRAGKVFSVVMNDAETGNTEVCWFRVDGLLGGKNINYDVTWLYTADQISNIGGDTFTRIGEKSGHGGIFDSDHTQSLSYDSAWKEADNIFIVGFVSRVDETVTHYKSSIVDRAEHAINVLLTRGSGGTPSAVWRALLPETWSTAVIDHYHTCRGCDSVHAVSARITVFCYPAGCSYSCYDIGRFCVIRLTLAQRIHRALTEYNMAPDSTARLTACLDAFSEVHNTEG